MWRTPWVLRLSAGTLYAVISRLESRGLIEALESEDRRRPYRLTAAGARAGRAVRAYA
jgi:DNA-binding PadR family transcriptional regulator